VPILVHQPEQCKRWTLRRGGRCVADARRHLERPDCYDPRCRRVHCYHDRVVQHWWRQARELALRPNWANPKWKRDRVMDKPKFYELRVSGQVLVQVSLPGSTGRAISTPLVLQSLRAQVQPAYRSQILGQNIKRYINAKNGCVTLKNSLCLKNWLC
jgi:hypothetical protein